jgi:dTDP-4-dehydrorhamnose reductase
VVGFNHADLDLSSSHAIAEKIGRLDFDLLINSAGLTNVDYCETHEQEAMQINARAVRQLAEICSGKAARMIHFSTDYVFDGEKRAPYSETDTPRPISIYGRSKLQGENELLNVSADNLVVRVSWVFGPDRPSFVDQILRRAMDSNQAAAIADKYAAPSFTLDIASYLMPFVHGGTAGGVLHFCNAGSCSWRDYGQFAIDCAVAAGLSIRARSVAPLTMESMANFVAKRPVYSVLSTDKITAIAGSAPRSWQDAVQDYVTNFFAKTFRAAG